jgi:CRP-like cAMP-binding protein
MPRIDVQPTAVRGGTGEGASAEVETRPASVSDSRDLNPVRSALRQLPLFADLSDSQVSDLSAATQLVTCAKNSYVFRRGDAGRALFVITTGVVDITVSREGAEPLVLATLSTGEFFGEMSLFDARERSADARAVVDTQLLSIDRTGLLSKLPPPLATKLLAELAKRVRKADATVSNLSDTVARAAHSHPSSAVAVELDTIRLLYARTQQIAADTLERAERRSAEVLHQCEATQRHADELLARAQGTLAEAEKQVEKVWKTLKSRVAPALAVCVAVLSYFGISSIDAAKQQLADVGRLHVDAEKQHAAVRDLAASSKSTADQLDSAYHRVRAIEESMGELRSVREAVGLDRALDRPERLKRAALNYERAKETIRRRYLASNETGSQFTRYAPEVVFEAVDTYVTLVLAGGDDGHLWLSAAERTELLAALSYVLCNLPDVDDVNQPGSSSQLMDRKLRDMVPYVAQEAELAQRDLLTEQLTEALRDGHSRRARQNVALSLADLQVNSTQLTELLLTMLRNESSWQAAAAAIGLAKLGNMRGAEFIDNLLTDASPAAAYPVALLLAEAGRPTLEMLVARNPGRQLETLIEAVSHVLRVREPRNCLEERYTDYLLGCLNGIGCSQLPPDSEDSCKRFAISHG